jgi:hypothetical protein
MSLIMSHGRYLERTVYILSVRIYTSRFKFTCKMEKIEQIISMEPFMK